MISKAIYGLLTSSKKGTDKFVLFAFLLCTEIRPFVFWENLQLANLLFSFIWPLMTQLLQKFLALVKISKKLCIAKWKPCNAGTRSIIKTYWRLHVIIIIIVTSEPSLYHHFQIWIRKHFTNFIISPIIELITNNVPKIRGPSGCGFIQ